MKTASFFVWLCHITWLIFDGKITAKYYAFCSVTYRWVLGQCNEDIVLDHRSRGHMRSLISPLQDIINVLFNGQLVAPSQNTCLSDIFLVKSLKIIFS